MKYFRKFTGIILTLIIVVMFFALFGHHSDEDNSSMPEHVGYSLNEGWQLVTPDGTAHAEIDLPYAGQILDSDTIIFRNMLSVEFAGMTMVFSCENADARVLFDGEVLYQQKAADISDDSEQSVMIPDTWQEGQEWAELCVELTVVNRSKEIVLEDVILGAGDTIIIGLVGNNLADIACCLLIVISAIILFVLALIRWYTNQPSRGGLFLGLFGLTAGIYCFIGTDTLNLFFDMQGIHVLQEYLMLMMQIGRAHV